MVKTKNKVLAGVAALAVAGVGVVAVSTAEPAEADVSTLCHYGLAIQPPVYVLEEGGAEYAVYPGECTPGDVNIRGFKPANGTSVSFKQSTTGDKLFRKSGVVQPVAWWSTLGNDISVSSTRYGN